jgi:photosystem II stability/assembly factor-like uncharacterized protein
MTRARALVGYSIAVILSQLPIIGGPQRAIAADASTAPFTKLGGVPGGNIGQIAFDPNNPTTMFVGSDGGGIIYRSTDGGANFTPISVGGIFERFRAITVDPKNSQIVIAFSSDDFNSGLDGAVYESRTGGRTWTKIPHQPVGAGHAGNGRGIFINAAGTTVVLTDGRQGIFYSADLGASWSNPLSKSQARAHTLTEDPNHPGTLWAGGYDVTNNFDGVLWKSTDTGKSWTKVTVSALDQNTGPLPEGIAILPGSGKILVSWFGADPKTGAFIAGIVSSSDGGTTWVNSSKGLSSDFAPGPAVVVDTRTPTTVYATTNGPSYPNGLFRSIDSGATWASIGAKLDGSDGVFVAAARPAKGATPAAIFVGEYDLFSSTDQGDTWSRLDTGIAHGSIDQIREDRLGADGLYASTYGGLFHSKDGGQDWTRISTWPGATVPRAIEVDPASSTHYIYAASQTTFWRSADAGAKWTSFAIPKAVGNITFLLADPTIKGRLYATDSANNVFRSINYGQTWSGVAVGKSGDVFTGFPAPLVFDSTNSSIIYAALTSGLYRSANSGLSWARTKLPADPGDIVSIAPLAGKPNAVFADAGYTPPKGSFSFSLQASTNNGGTWATHASPFAAVDPNSASDTFSLATSPKATALFAYGFGAQVMRSLTGANGSWGLVDAPLEPFIPNNAFAFASTDSLYVWSNSGPGNAFKAPLSSVKSTDMSGRKPATGPAEMGREKSGPSVVVP